MSASPLTHLFGEDLYQIPVPVTVILRRSWEQYSSEEKALLSKILGSIKLDIAAVNVTSRTSISVSELKGMRAEKLLIFGTAIDQFKPYEHDRAQGFSVVRADDLSDLDDAKKKSLWLALRNMFGI